MDDDAPRARAGGGFAAFLYAAVAAGALGILGLAVGGAWLFSDPELRQRALSQVQPLADVLTSSTRAEAAALREAGCENAFFVDDARALGMTPPVAAGEDEALPYAFCATTGDADADAGLCSDLARAVAAASEDPPDRIFVQAQAGEVWVCGGVYAADGALLAPMQAPEEEV